MATTATIDFSDEKKKGNFEYKDGAYTLKGSATADLVNGTFINANGSILKDGEAEMMMPEGARFNASKRGDEVKVDINGVDAADLSTVSSIVTACIAKVAAHYA